MLPFPHRPAEVQGWTIGLSSVVLNDQPGFFEVCLLSHEHTSQWLTQAGKSYPSPWAFVAKEKAINDIQSVSQADKTAPF